MGCIYVALPRLSNLARDVPAATSPFSQTSQSLRKNSSLIQISAAVVDSYR